jgi:hypothetical protein
MWEDESRGDDLNWRRAALAGDSAGPGVDVPNPPTPGPVDGTRPFGLGDDTQLGGPPSDLGGGLSSWAASPGPSNTGMGSSLPPLSQPGSTGQYHQSAPASPGSPPDPSSGHGGFDPGVGGTTSQQAVPGRAGGWGSVGQRGADLEEVATWHGSNPVPSSLSGASGGAPAVPGFDRAGAPPVDAFPGVDEQFGARRPDPTTQAPRPVPDASGRPGAAGGFDTRWGQAEPGPFQENEFDAGGHLPGDDHGGSGRGLLIPLALLAVAALAGVGWWFLRGPGAGDEVASEGDATESVDTTVAAPAAEEQTTTTEVTQASPQVDEPTLLMPEAEQGPLQEGTQYAIELLGAPAGSTLEVVVDDRPQGSAGEILPVLLLPAGRHKIEVAITAPDGTNDLSTPVEVYVLGADRPTGYTANLASIDIVNEGWAYALQRYDEYRAAGHDGLQLQPLTEGYYNIFVPGMGEDADTVIAYCEQFGLAYPTDCFAKYYEAAAGATDSGTGDTADDGGADDMDG